MAAKPRIRQTAWGNWYGYRGNKKVEMFFNSSTETMEQMAERWLAEERARDANARVGQLLKKRTGRTR